MLDDGTSSLAGIGMSMEQIREPSYVRLARKGELAKRAAEAREASRRCVLCPRACRVDRLSGPRGECRTGERAAVCSAHPHLGEEPPLVGRHGSGTIFFTHCNLRCVYCQNYDISHLGAGYEVEATELAEMMLKLQQLGCHNINFVSPTHVVPQILEALIIAVEMGLHLPLVYNSGGYDSVATLRLLDGVFDIYMPDMKYSDPVAGERYSEVRSYPGVNRAAVKEMHRQVGDLVVDSSGVAQRGLLVRHLVLPNGLGGTEDILRFLADSISRDTYVNIMDQYRPCFKANQFPELNRRLAANEHLEALRTARALGLHRGF